MDADRLVSLAERPVDTGADDAEAKAKKDKKAAGVAFAGAKTPAERLSAGELLKRADSEEKRATDMSAQLTASREAETTRRDAERKSSEEAFTHAADDLSATVAQGAKKAELPNPDLGPMIDPKQMETLAMGMIFLSLAGVAGGKGAWGNATAALDGFLQGVKQGTKDAYTVRAQNFKREFDVAMQKQKEYDAEYKSILESKQLSVNKQLELIRIQAAANKDYDLLEAAKRRDLEAIYKHVDRMDSRAQQLQFHADQLENWAQNRADRQAARDASTASKGGAWMRDPQGALHFLTPEMAEQIDTTGWTPIQGKGLSSGSATQQRMQNVVYQDVSNAVYNIGRLAEMSKKQGSPVGGSAAFANKFSGDLSGDLKRYMTTKVLPSDLQGVDALLLNLSFDIASGQSGGTAQMAQAKISELHNQMPLQSQPEDTRRERWNALLHRVDAMNATLPPEKQIKVPDELKSTLGLKESSKPAASAGKAPSGVDQGDWDYMTDDQRALWKK